MNVKLWKVRSIGNEMYVLADSFDKAVVVYRQTCAAAYPSSPVQSFDPTEVVLVGYVQLNGAQMASLINK